MSASRIWPESADPFLFLEELDDPAVRGWVDEQNARTHDAWRDSAKYHELVSAISKIYLPHEKPVIPTRWKDWAYNYWTDGRNPKGLWRRTSWTSWLERKPQWETLIDFDAVGKAEGTPWSVVDIGILYGDGDRALFRLSPDGGDALVVREFDIERRGFVSDGFAIETVGKHWIDWIDRDTVYVSCGSDDAALTRSGYPREVRRWVRGTALADASLVFRGEFDDVYVHGYYDPIERYHVIAQAVDTYDANIYHVAANGEWVRYDAPAHVTIGLWHGWLLLQPRLDWLVGGVNHMGGSLLTIREDAFLAGSREFVALFVPTQSTSACYWSYTRYYLIASWLDDVQSRTVLWRPVQTDEKWSWHARAFPVRQTSQVTLRPIEVSLNDEVYVEVEDYLLPIEYSLADLADDDLSQWQLLDRWPTQFDATSLTVRREHAQSRDGTLVPYTLIGPRAVLESETPVPASCLLIGYGGFAVPLTPEYDPGLGVGWLEKGGVAAVAHIRGGGEYGSHWHAAAQKEYRQRGFDDFISVAEKLIADGITTPDKFGIAGGSNGGLLVAACMVQRPELFGAVVCAVPVLDMQRYHLLLAGPSWVDEYGDPDDPHYARALAAYSPYHRVESGTEYPPVLFTTSTADDRVHPAHARKMVARMLAQGHKNVWLWEKTEGGHGSSDALDAAEDEAIKYEFLQKNLMK